MFVFLSFPLGEKTPTFADNPPVKFTQMSSIARGDIANFFNVETINHNGTHIDAPLHFNNNGKAISELALEEFIFERPVVVDWPKGDGELITAADMEAISPQVEDADLLLLRTGFGQWRDQDPVRYGKRNPGFDGSAGQYMLDHFPSLRAIGMDLPSAASAVHMKEGFDFHQVVLGTRGGDRYILILEDCHLHQDLSGLKRVIVAPLILEGLDAAPCTILGEI